PERPARPVVHLADRTYGIRKNPLGKYARLLGGRVAGRDLRGEACLACGSSHGARLLHGMRHGLLAVDVFAGVQRRKRDDGMQVVGRADHYGIGILLLEEIAEIDVGRTAGAARISLLVEPVDDLLCRLQARPRARRRCAPGRVAEQLTNLALKLALAPLHIIAAPGVYVADRSHADVVALEQLHHHAQALRADADAGNLELVTGRGEAHAAEHVARNDHGGRSGGGSFDKRAAGNRSVRIHGDWAGKGYVVLGALECSPYSENKPVPRLVDHVPLRRTNVTSISEPADSVRPDATSGSPPPHSRRGET